MRKLPHLKQAIEWMGRQGRHDSEFLDFVSRRFDLDPLESEFFLREFKKTPHSPVECHRSVAAVGRILRPARRPDIVEAILGQPFLGGGVSIKSCLEFNNRPTRSAFNIVREPNVSVTYLAS